MTIDEIITRLDDRNIMEVSKRTGIKYITLLRFYKRETKNPRYEMIDTLIKYLSNEE